jgi:mannitol-1-phosphate 5-dehydrogenase
LLLKGADRTLNVILCENYYQPAKLLRGMIDDLLPQSDRGWFQSHIGIAEALVLRSCIEPTDEMRKQDPLSLKVQNAWQLPVDAEALVGAPPEIPGLEPQRNFQGRLTQKLFTYNAINAVVCYLGHLQGFTVLSEAANDPEISRLAEQAGEEASEALIRRFGFDPEDQRKLAELALGKYQKKEIVDPIERNARDPLRKLSRNDRLIGPAQLALETGVRPVALAQSIAAALRYVSPTDPAALRLQEIIKTGGVEAALKKVCGIEPDSELARMVLENYAAHENGGGQSVRHSARRKIPKG